MKQQTDFAMTTKTFFITSSLMAILLATLANANTPSLEPQLKTSSQSSSSKSSNKGNSGGGGGNIYDGGIGGFMGRGGGFGIPGFGGGFPGNGIFGGGYGSGFGTPTGGYSKGGVIRPTVVCKEKGRCYGKKLTCPAKCFSSYSRSSKNYGAGGGGGGCTVDCKKKCIAYC